MAQQDGCPAEVHGATKIVGDGRKNLIEGLNRGKLGTEFVEGSRVVVSVAIDQPVDKFCDPLAKWDERCGDGGEYDQRGERVICGLCACESHTCQCEEQEDIAAGQ
ncbi:MAG: hypothetical protein ACR2GA_05565 [Chloroflexota bacterium]